MNIKLASLLLLICSLYSCTTRPYENQFGDLNQAAKSVTETYYPAQIDSLGEVSIKEDQPFSGLKIEYNSKGWITHKSYFDSEGKVDATYHRTYDPKGRVKVERFIASDDSTAWVSELEQMMGDQLLYKEYEESHPDELVFVTLKYQNDTITRWINNTLATREIYNEHLLPQQKFTYAENGDDFSEENFTYEGKLLMKLKYEGPEEKDDNIYTYEYVEFDAKNNWIKRIGYRNGRPDRITLREINY